MSDNPAPLDAEARAAYLKEKYRNEEGNVITGPPNVKAMPMKKGTVPSNTRRLGQSSSLFQAVHDHVVGGKADNYDRQKEILKEDLKYHRDMVGERPPFSQNANHGWKKKNGCFTHFGTINHPCQILAENPPIPPREDAK